MNEDQIQKFINACKNAGFEVVGDDEVCAWVGALAKSFRRETTADAIFEAFCEVYK